MAQRQYRLNEVVERIDGSDFEDSDDDFDGYLDSESEENMRERDERDAEVGDGVSSEVNVGANVEVGGCSSDSEESEADEVPVYDQQAGWLFSISRGRDNSMLQYIVDQTNLYAQQFIESHELGPHSRVRYWYKTAHNISELLRFLAIIILMGLVRYPQIEHHWSTQWPYSTAHCEKYINK